MGPLSLSTLYQETDVSVESLQLFEQERISDSLPAESLEDARDIVNRLSR